MVGMKVAFDKNLVIHPIIILRCKMGMGNRTECVATPQGFYPASF